MKSAFAELKLSHLSAGFVAILVGYTSSVAIIFQAATALGADQITINSWLLVLGLGMGVSSITLSWYYKMPILTAWSTPGAAMLAMAGLSLPMSEVIGGFIISAVLITLSGVTGSFERISKVISPAIAAAMLAGVLLQFCLNIFLALESEPLLVIGMSAVYLAAKQYLARYAIPLVLVIGCLISWHLNLFELTHLKLAIAHPVFIAPGFSFSAAMSIGIPLFIVTMTSQNMPGIAALHAFGFRPPLSPVISVTGITTFVLAPFGGFAFNLAAITAAICLSEEADANPKTRFLAAVAGGFFYLLVGIFGATVAVVFSISPQALVFTLAGLALVSTFANSFAMAIEKQDQRDAAVLTFLVTASGVVFMDIGSAFWGLLIGLLLQQLNNQRCNKNK